jgi:hypothetical protein
VTGSAYSDIFQADDGGVSRYEALLLKAEHRFNHNFTILANYTYSHCISDVDFIGDIGGAQTQDPNNLKGEHGNCGFDIRNALSVSVVFELRFEAFNLANHPNFSNPDSTLSDSTFGQIQSDAGPGILQFAVRFHF